MEKTNFVFVVASEENGYTEDKFYKDSLDIAMGALKWEVENVGGVLEEGACIWEGEDEEGFEVVFGAFDVNTSLYGEWLNLIAKKQKCMEIECDVLEAIDNAIDDGFIEEDADFENVNDHAYEILEYGLDVKSLTDDEYDYAVDYLLSQF